MSNRIELLNEYLKDDPDDAFTLYALALEYLNAGDKIKAKEFFTSVINKHPGYLPAYYHFGKLCEYLNEKEKANELYLNGITLAQKQNDQHTLKELKEAYDSYNGIDDEEF